MGEEGMGALYKGLPAGLMRAVISGGGRLFAYNGLKAACISNGLLHPLSTQLASAKASASSFDQVLQVALRASLASIAGCGAQLVAAPMDLIRTQQSACTGKAENMWVTGRAVVQAHGFR